MELTKEQQQVLQSEVKDLVVSASAGSGKTFVVIEKLIGLICDKKIPVERLLVLTFTKAVSNEMKNRLYSAILEKPSSKFLVEQIDSLPLSDISTIDSFCEKIIKRNINKLDLDENFTILDEKSAKNLKKLAFSRTFQHFSQNESDKFEEIYFAFKRNKSSIEECIFDLQDYLSSANNQQQLLNDFRNNIVKYDVKAQEFLKDKIQSCFLSADILLKKLNKDDLGKAAENVYLNLKNIISQNFDTDLFGLCKNLISFLPLPAMRGKMEEEDKIILTKARDFIKDGLAIAENFSFLPESIKEKAKEGRLVNCIIDFYVHYSSLYNDLKAKRDGLDFADIEYYAKILLEDEEVKIGLQNKYDYIFVDEYQDTNRLQQSILKPIAEGGCFIAVGDLKQGIYGFRNARMEIMQEDISNFSAKKDGDALFLTGNFRTDKNILDFVNSIFEKVMTIESTGIDYKKTSMLKGLKHYESGTMPAVAVDVVLKNSIEEVERSPEIYSVKDDVIKSDQRFTNEILAIQSRIEEALQSEIYDAKRQCFRKVNYSDITLLFRNRSALMKETYKTLSQKGFPVNADIKESLFDDSEIGVIYSLLKLTLNQHDDISLASAMTSIFGGFDLEEMADLRLENDKTFFYEIVENSKNEKVIKFIDMVEKFKFEIQIFGIIKALNRLFNKFDYYNYLHSLPDGQEKITNINALFKLIRSGDLDNNVSGVVSQIEGVNENKGGGGNAISMTTIHATKGLEYPIVILCGAGESLSKPYLKNYVISENFGFASFVNDFEKMIKTPSPSFVAGKLEKNAREFVDEIMIFYVAMTRAQNHLFIIGSGKEKDYSFENFSKQNSYLKMIFYALGENLTAQLFSQEKIERGRVEFNVFNEFEERHFDIEKIENSTQKFAEEIKKYNDFSYQNKEICKFSFKNSVTGAIKLNDEKQILPYQTESNEENKTAQIAIDRGNAYHEALRYLDFEKINSLNDLENQMKIVCDFMSEGYCQLIDNKLLFKNILLIKELTAGCKLYKEKEFIMQATLNEIGAGNSDEKVIVQGIVDLFAVGDEIVLIDYKFSSLSRDNLKQRYEKQINLYARALEKAFNKKIEKRYLLSLKKAEIINL